MNNEFYRISHNEVYRRLYNDVCASIFEEPYLLNQEGDINTFNTFKKRNKDFKDGGKVCKNNKNYCCYYSFDYEDRENKNKKCLFLRSYEGSTGMNLLDFINSVINSKEDAFVKIKDFVIKDARKYLFEIVEIKIFSSEIDDSFIKILKRYFHCLEKIEFKNCTIKKDCNFSKLKSEIEFENCTIETIRSFNDCQFNIKLSKCQINTISPTTVNCKKMEIDKFSRKKCFDLKELFFKCNFPQLSELIIDKDSFHYTYSFEDAFTFLPYSAPNIERLFIRGKVKSLDFLTKFKHLVYFKIFSIEDDWGFGYANVTDGKERRKIFERNKKEYEIVKILDPYKDDECIIADLEAERILKLCHFLSLINYSKETEEIFKNKSVIDALLSQKISEDVNYYYDCYFDELVLRKQNEEYDIHFDTEEKFKISNNTLYLYDFFKGDKQIVKAVNFIYAANGIPIIFRNVRKKNRSIEEAKNKMDGIEIHNFSLDECNKNLFIDFIKEFDLDYSISIGSFIDAIQEVCGVKLSGKEFLTFKEGKKLYYLFEMYNRLRKRIDDLENKQQKCMKLLEQLIVDNYKLFNVAEKAYLYMHDYDDALSKIYNLIVKDEVEVLNSINLKTNGLYTKYHNYIKLFSQLQKSCNNPYDEIEIKPEYIKRLSIDN